MDYICRCCNHVYTIFNGDNFLSFGQVAQEKFGCWDVRECLVSPVYHDNRIKGLPHWKAGLEVL